MNGSIKVLLGFIGGVAVGATASFFIVKEKCKKEADESVAQARQEYLEMQRELHEANLHKPDINDLVYHPTGEVYYTARGTNDIPVDPIFTDMKAKQTEQYLTENKMKETENNNIEILEPNVIEIESEEYGENPEYSCETLYYFKDTNQLTDEYYEEIDIQAHVGNLPINRLTRDNNAMYGRDDRRKVYYEIVWDEDLASYKNTDE